MHQLPPWFQTVSALFLFFVELVVPFLYFAPRRLRVFACVMTVLLQLLIAGTGNYAFFNLLTVALAVLLVDDQSLPECWRNRAEAATLPLRRWPRLVLASIAVVALFASGIEFAATLDRSLALPGPVVAAVRRLGAFRSFNGYGLFMVMTTERPEIVVEGSRDGVVWRPYEFRWKPGDPVRRPRFVAPAPAAPRLADVVRGPRRLRAEPVARALSRAPARRLARSRGASGERSVPGPAAAATCAPCSTTTASRTPPSAAGPAPGGSGVSWGSMRPFSRSAEASGGRKNQNSVRLEVAPWSRRRC